MTAVGNELSLYRDMCGSSLHHRWVACNLRSCMGMETVSWFCLLLLLSAIGTEACPAGGHACL